MIVVTTIVVLASFGALIIGLIKPSFISLATRKQVVLIYGGVLIAAIVFSLILSGETEQPAPTPIATPTVEKVAESQPTKPSQAEKDTAQKEFDEVMALAKKSGLVSSYELTGSSLTVYADGVWYSQTVAFKKDFVAKMSVLKKTITGYHRLEVRDAHSNEKLAEVTAFSGSLEIYK